MHMPIKVPSPPLPDVAKSNYGRLIGKTKAKVKTFVEESKITNK